MTPNEASTILQAKYSECKSFYDLSANPEEDYPGATKYLQAIEVALSALAPLSNEPLTPDELREMRGQPYWHVGLRKESPPPHWNILDPFYAKHIEDYRYGENWIAYRHPPEEEG